MIILDHVLTLQTLAAATGKHAMYINITWPANDDVATSIDHVITAAPYLKDKGQVLIDNSAFILFDDEDEMRQCYQSTVGDDGPTKLNPYNGPACVYALTCRPNGDLDTENT